MQRSRKYCSQEALARKTETLLSIMQCDESSWTNIMGYDSCLKTWKAEVHQIEKGDACFKEKEQYKQRLRDIRP